MVFRGQGQPRIIKQGRGRKGKREGRTALSLSQPHLPLPQAWLTEIHEYAQRDVVIMLLGNKVSGSMAGAAHPKPLLSLTQHHLGPAPLLPESVSGTPFQLTGSFQSPVQGSRAPGGLSSSPPPRAAPAGKAHQIRGCPALRSLLERSD